MADYSYFPIGWTCQALLNNATQNLGYDMHAPTLEGHPSVRPVHGEPNHMMAGAPTGSVGGPISNEQMRLHQDPATKKGYSDGVPAINDHPEIPEGTSKKEAAAMTGPEAVGSNVSTPLTRDGRTPDPVPVPYSRPTVQGEKDMADAHKRSAPAKPNGK